MSIMLTDISSMPPIHVADPGAQLHQSSSGPSATIRPRGWWSWFDRQDERIALREVSDDPHLFNDLGLTREQALHEAAKPFWR